MQTSLFFEATDKTKKVIFVFPYGIIRIKDGCHNYWQVLQELIVNIINYTNAQILLLYCGKIYTKQKLKDNSKFFDKYKNRIQIIQMQNLDSVWVRDFMPIGIADNKALKALYYPTYYEDERFDGKEGDRKYAKNADNVGTSLTKVLRYTLQNLKFRQKDIILDGGNFIHNKKIGFISARVLTENFYLNNKIEVDTDLLKDILFQADISEFIVSLKNQLFLEALYILPSEQESDNLPEVTGHIDGSLRFLTQDIIVIDENYFENYKEFLEPIFRKHNLKIQPIYQDLDNNTIFLNYLRVNDTVFLPRGTNIQDDFYRFKTLCFKNSIKSVEIEEEGHISRHSGVFNCISWAC